jgi:tetratricopeptide (TPR) repeat protein
VSVVRDYADYKSTYRVDGHTLTVDRAIHCKVAELPTSRGADYLAFVRAIRADEDQRVELTRKGGAPASPSTATANWNDKGLAQLASNQLDQAEASFRKQIEINAFDEFAHNNLGRVLWRERKYPEAEAAFRKQIEVNPLDQYAWNNLGSMLNGLGNYAEARPALEKAVGIKPNDAALRVTLGGLYLHLKLDAEGLAAFEKAVQISPTPPIWNDIAYALATNGVHLDRAQQYAESAINGHATMLRETTLDKLTPAQLRLVMSLAADWDTLGWILFKRGDLAGAERYLRASWMLGQNGEVGDHLGQAYEKQGKRREAIGVYAEALATRSAPEDTPGRLDRLIKAGPGGAAATPLDKLMTQSVSAILELRTISIPRPASVKPADEVYARALVLLDSTSKTAEVKFVGAGSAEAPPALADGLRTAPYPMPWPDTSAIRLVRRVRVHCEVDAKTCLVLLEHPNEVRTPEP